MTRDPLPPTRQPQPPGLAQLSLDEYVELTRDLPLPTDQQRDHFVDYVAHAHSWYKHLPRDPPGAPFYFYLDPHAGLALELDGQGGMRFARRSAPQRHYADLPTDEYLRRYGHLSYFNRSGTEVRIVDSEGRPLELARERCAVLPGLDGEPRDLPSEVDEAGRVELTFVIQTQSAMWCGFQGPSQWPAESGGQATLTLIAARRAVLDLQRAGVDGADEDEANAEYAIAGGAPYAAQELPMVDRVLHRLVAPEQRRQHGLMRAAVDRVCAMVSARR